jgi:hypothetical protein
VYRALITAVAAAALVFGGAVPATAHTSWSSVPGAPAAVRVTGDADSATLTWRGPKHGAKVTGWKVAVAAVANRHDRQVDRLHQRARADRFDELSPATTYRFSIRALGHRGAGRTITLRWTAPPAPEPETTQSLFGLDGNGDVVRFADSGSGAKTVVATDGEGFAANADGDVFTPTADGTSILLHPADGGGISSIASGLHLTPDLRSDAAGNLYWVDSVTGAVQKLSAGTSTPKTVLDLGGKAVGSDQRFWTVTPDGKVVVLGGTVSQPYVKGTGIAPRTFTGPIGTIARQRLRRHPIDRWRRVVGLVPAQARGDPTDADRTAVRVRVRRRERGRLLAPAVGGVLPRPVGVPAWGVQDRPRHPGQARGGQRRDVDRAGDRADCRVAGRAPGCRLRRRGRVRLHRQRPLGRAVEGPRRGWSCPAARRGAVLEAAGDLTGGARRKGDRAQRRVLSPFRVRRVAVAAVVQAVSASAAAVVQAAPAAVRRHTSSHGVGSMPKCARLSRSSTTYGAVHW